MSMRFQLMNSETVITFPPEPFSPPAEQLLAVCDTNSRLYLPPDIPEESVIELAPGEEHKTWESVDRILMRAAANHLDRSAVFLGVGGGVVTDMTAFAASLYMRGVRLFLKPTSLLAMVDASFGGKTGIDYQGYKNLVGTFYPAEKLHIDGSVLKTLPEREFRGGLAEVVKTALLGDPRLLSLLEEESDAVRERNLPLIEEIVRRCLAVKGAFVESDLREKGIRAHLNLGHTFAHALESVTHFTWSHGEAVAWGLVAASRLVNNRPLAVRIENVLVKLGLPVEAAGVNPEELLEAMLHDKKRREGRQRVIVLPEIGQAEIREVCADEILAVLEG